MKLGEKTLKNVNLDYRFLRDNRVPALTAIYMVGLAYKKDIVVVVEKSKEKKRHEC